ncbi:MAG: pyridoxamine 5'-phosphate oxidase family protein [Armatimonadota bacterium]|nr:pyridoxamine 5'-phosphate oxidase family protein [bacterium]
MSEQDIRERARAIINSSENSVLITQDEHGFPHPRTMWTAGVDDDFTTYFVTGRPLLKIHQVEANNKVCCFWTQVDGKSIGWNYAHIKGEASVSDDQALRDRFWNDMLKDYFPQGKDDPNFVVLVIKPKELMVMDSHKYPLDKIEF